MRENGNLDINFTSRDCFVHKREKVIVYLNFDDGNNNDIKIEQEKLVPYYQEIQVGFSLHLDNVR